MITPAVIIDYDVMMSNLTKVQSKCTEKKIKIRPHFKAHKTPYLATIQQELGAIGFTTAKLSEAELLVEEGFRDIVVAYPIVNEFNAERLKRLWEQADVKGIVDSRVSIDVLEKVFRGKKLDVYIKIDTGLNRCGLKPTENLVEFAQYINKTKNLSFVGLLTHAGHSYKAKSIDELRKIGFQEGEILLDIKNQMESKDIEVSEISVGSTPTLNYVIEVEGITEVRPGNYIFNDYTQVSLESAEIKDCALTVKSTVISKGDGKIIIDAGAKALGLDKGTHGNETIKGYGKIIEYPDLEIYALSEEHGFVFGSDLPEIGEIVTIIPNHSCVVMNLAPFVFLKKNNKIEKIYNNGRNLNY